ncbi:cell wall-binding repeat-containing protein [Herbiconiux sp. VKM Ac-2851]|uniref:cell wall-binding repeat-containing protein n=1 Tax=Herbiconiux sp. VKM Ac-2851 TaxID=2739025 RepID=UPI0015651A23|nr:cell wall-binding repeat-containing protein [Herbiconiux sp. VKM Ac-2851]NQX36988.1 cell wall-binding repeat-containing protein [Herbiconiux sp. VKM Ac-2851]
MTTARRTALAGAAIAALLLSGAAVTTSAAADDSRPPIEVPLVPAGRSLDASWDSFAYVPSRTERIHVTLPPELADYELTGYAWSLSGFPSDLRGAFPALSTSFDIELPDEDAVTSTLRLLVSGATAGTGDAASLTASFVPVVPAQGHPPLVTVDADLAPGSSAAGGIRQHAYTAGGQPVALVAGERLDLVERPGFWTTGPDSDWGHKLFREIVLHGPGSSVPLEGIVSDDGSVLQIALPEDLGDFRADRLSVVMDAAPVSPGIIAGVSFETPVVVERAITATRVGGADRYAVAAAASAAQFPGGAPVAYVVTGESFADALSAGPAAAKEGGPLLLTRHDGLSDATAAELERLQPGRIVVVGGASAVSDGVLDALAAIAPVQRIGGADRFAVSRAVLSSVFGDATAGLYLATGDAFPDALAAGAAAGAAQEPVLIVDGRASALDDATAEMLGDLPIERVTIVGGPAAVSEGLADEVSGIAPTQRYGGADRFEVAAALNAAVFDFAPQAFVATGADFPDALAGAAWAGRVGAPLYVTRPDCLPADALAAMRGQDVSSLTVLGGPRAVADPVLALTTCGD